MSLISFEEALQRLLAGARPVERIEDVDTVEASGRVLARAQTSGLTVPPFDNSAMDGYAMRRADVPQAGVRLPVSQRIAAGHVGVPLAAGTAARIFTGAPVPPGADAVIMQELCEHVGEGVIQINRVPRENENLRRAGEDIRAGSEILAAGRRLAPQDIGLAASVGLATLPVYRRLRVAVFFTGDELSLPGEALKPGGIYNSARYTLRGLLTALGCEVRDLGIVRDNLEATRAALRAAASDADVVITSGGVSVGEEDHVKAAVQAEGELNLWKIALKPGKPLAFGKVSAGGTAPAGGALFIGLPGNPVSGFATFITLVRPFLLACQGVMQTAPRAITLRADFDWARAEPRREFLRARINDSGGLDLFAHQGSGVLTSCVWADGLVDNPPGQKIRQGDPVRFLPFTELLY